MVFYTVIGPVLTGRPTAYPVTCTGRSEGLFTTLMASRSMGVSFGSFRVRSESFFVPSGVNS